MLKRIIFSFILKSGFLALPTIYVFWRLLVLRFDLNTTLFLYLLLSMYFSFEWSLPSVLLTLFYVNILVDMGTCFFFLSLLFKSYPSPSFAPWRGFFSMFISNIGPLMFLSLWISLHLIDRYLDCLRDLMGRFVALKLFIDFFRGGTIIYFLFSDILFVSKWSVGLVYCVRWL